MSVERLREQSLTPAADSCLIRGLAGDKLAGYAFATRWDYEGRQICWVTQLCVSPEHRGKKLATKVCGTFQLSVCNIEIAERILQILLRLRDGKDRDFGILSSHPAAILGALRAWGRGIEEVDLGMVREHAAGIMAASPVQYVKNAKLKGTLFGEDNEGGICCADTQFWVDHGEPLAALAELKKRVTWPFGGLPEGCEFLVLVKAAPVDDEGGRVRRKEKSSDF